VENTHPEKQQLRHEKTVLTEFKKNVC